MTRELRRRPRIVVTAVSASVAPLLLHREPQRRRPGRARGVALAARRGLAMRRELRRRALLVATIVSAAAAAPWQRTVEEASR